MYPVFTQAHAGQHIAELHQQAARQRLVHELRSRPARAAPHRHRRVWNRLPFRWLRPARA